MKDKSPTAKEKKRKTFGKILGILTDILIYPIIALSLVVSFVMLNSKQDNKVYSVLGVSIVKILSGSMIAGGFNVDDIVIITQTNTDNLRVGDIIAFYRYSDANDPFQNTLTKIEDFDNLPPITSSERVCGNKTQNDAIEAESPVIFHRIINIYQAQDGTRFFETQGDSNSTADSFYTREDFIVGKYFTTPRWLTSAFSFCATPKGMIILVIIPLSFLIFLQLLEIFEIINALIIEKKVLNLEMSYDCEESIKNNIGFDMRDYDKVYFYDIMPESEKNNVKDFLWGNLYVENNKKSVAKLKSINAGLVIYEYDRQEYWSYFVRKAKTKRVKDKLKKLEKVASTIKYGNNLNPMLKLKQQLLQNETANLSNRQNKSNTVDTQNIKENTKEQKTEKVSNTDNIKSKNKLPTENEKNVQILKPIITGEMVNKPMKPLKPSKPENQSNSKKINEKIGDGTEQNKANLENKEEIIIDRMQKSIKPEKPHKASKSETTVVLAKLEKPTRPQKPQKPEQPPKPEKPTKSDSGDIKIAGEEFDKNFAKNKETSPKPKRPTVPIKPQKSVVPAKPDKLNRPKP